MSKKLKFTSLILFLFLSVNSTFAQKQAPFSLDKFPDDIKQYLKIYPEKKKPKEYKTIDSLLISLETDWTSGTFSDTEKLNILTIARFYQKKRLKTKDFEPLFTTIYGFKKGTKANYEQWLQMATEFIPNSKTSTNLRKYFINQTYNFIINGYLYTSKRVQWTVSETNFSIKFDKTENDLLFIFSNTDLSCTFGIKKNYKTTPIKNTKATFSLMKNLWVGKSGTVDWERNGYKKTEVFARLNNYQFSLRNADFQADSVTFKNTNLSKQEFLGVLTEKISPFTLKREQFPEFTTYKKDLFFENIFPNTNFTGAATMKGSTFLGTGSNLLPAEVDYFRDNKKFISALSNKFKFSSSGVFSQNAKIYLYIGSKDSIIHSSVELDINDGGVNIERTEKAAGKSNFHDSYHKIEINCHKISWAMGDTTLEFFEGIGKGMRILSQDYFTISDFDRIQMRDNKSPLFEILSYMRYLTARAKVEPHLDDPKIRKKFGFTSHYDLLNPKRQAEELERVLFKIAARIPHDSIEAEGINEFFTDNFAQFLKKNSTAVKQRVIGLSFEGFVEYTAEDNRVKVLPKLYHYTDSRAGVKDYDVINILSRRQEFSTEYLKTNKVNNATLSLNSLDLQMQGVDRIVLSERKRVGVRPYDNSVIIKKNRNMEFDGRLIAGIGDFYGEKMKFNYQNFNIEMTKADRLDLGLGSNIEDITGVLSIDTISNKSGVINDTTQNFPNFRCTKPSFVYYDKTSKQDSVYNRDKFFFENKPFFIKNLGYLKNEDLAFDGHLESGGILPVINEKLTVQEDNSLGFVHKTPKEGLKLFEGKGDIADVSGKFNSEVTLSNEGFGASGQIKWNTTTVYSSNFLFFPDSMNTVAKSIKIEKSKTKNVEYPTVFADSVYTHWDPNNEVIYYTNLDKEMSMYDDKTTLAGQLVYTPQMLTGSGTFVIKEGRYKSDKYQFGENTFEAKETRFNLFTPTGTMESFKAFDMQTFTDVKNNKAVFLASNSDSSFVEFTKNKYQAKPNFFSWDINKYNIDIETNLRPKVTGAQAMNKARLSAAFPNPEIFFSKKSVLQKYTATIHPEDSLRLKFDGSTANYNGKKFILTISDVPFIQVADIEVIPAEGDKVIIQEKGVMRKLLKTNLTARNKHTITDVDINIMDRDEYQASSGTYQYANEKGELQPISFTEIKYNNQNKRSEASGDIKKEDNFMINDKFAFFGPVMLHADNDFLYFKGSTKIFYDCDPNNKPYWVLFKARINPKKVKIPISPIMYSPENTKILADIVLSTDSIHLYTSFFSNEKKKGMPVLSLRDSANFLTYNKTTSKYIISNEAKLNDKSLRGNYLELDPKHCIVKGEGKITFDQNTKQGQGIKFKHVKISAAGGIKNDIMKKTANLSTMLSFDFFMNKKAMKIFNDKIETNLIVSSVAADRDEFKIAMTQLIGVDSTAILIQELAINGNKLKRMPTQLQHTLFFSDLKLKWDDISKSYKSTGRLGLGGVNDNFHNRYLEGYLQIVDIPNNYAFRIYIETNTNEWFYFSYFKGTLKAVSSVAEFNDAIEKTKEKDRKQDVKYGSFKYTLATLENKNNFIQMFTGKAVIPVDTGNTNGNTSGNGNTNGNNNGENDFGDD